MARRTADGGYTLVEVAIASLLMAILTVPIMSLALTSRLSGGRAERRQAAAAAVRSLAEHLKGYVTADLAAAPGPNPPSDGVMGWSLPQGQPGVWALAAGTHQVSAARWAPALAPYNARLSYTVVHRNTPSGVMPDVTFSVQWDEP